MNKKILLLLIFTAFTFTLSAQQRQENSLFVQEVPKVALHKSYQIVDAVNIGTIGVQYMALDSDFLLADHELATTLTYARIRKTGFYAKLGVNEDLQTFTMGPVFKIGKVFRPYFGVGMLFHKGWYNLPFWSENNVESFIDLGVSQEYVYQLYEANDYWFSFNATYEVGTMLLIKDFVITLGVGGIYNGNFPFYKNALVYNVGLGYTFGDVKRKTPKTIRKR